MEYILMFLLVVTGLFLILVVLIQRGRGGGLAGAFGGAGGQSAFGTKAGDLFTRVTIGVAAFWIILCAISVKMLSNTGSMFTQNSQSTSAPGAAGGKTEEVAPKSTGTDSTKAGSEKADDKSSTEPAAGSGKASDAPAAATQGSATPSAPVTAEAPAPQSPPAEAPATETPATKSPAEK